MKKLGDKRRIFKNKDSILINNMRLANQKDIVSIDDFLSTYNHPDHHHAKRMASHLKERQLLQLR